MTLSERQAVALVVEIIKIREQVATLRSAFTTATEKVDKARARLGVLTSATDLVTDELATVSRADRNTRWT